MKDVENPLLKSSSAATEKTLFGIKTAYEIVRDSKPELLENKLHNQLLLRHIQEWLFTETEEAEDIDFECSLADDDLFEGIYGLKLMIEKYGKDGVDIHIQQQKEKLAVQFKSKD